jgi:hypothetical protein
MSAFDVLERQLYDSARRRHRRIRLAPAVLALAVAAGLFAVLLPRGPEPSDERPAAPTPPPAPTWTPVLGDNQRGHASISRSPFPPDQLRALAILRRPPTERDRSAAVRRLLSFVGSHGLHGVRVDSIRVLSQHGKRLALLVPAVRAGEHAPGIPASKTVQHDALCVFITVVARGSGPYAGKLGGAGSTCGTLASFREHGYIGFTLPAFGLVPDGVAGVKLRLRGGRTIIAPVGNNVYDLTDMGDAGFPIQPPVWLDMSGHRIPRR